MLIHFNVEYSAFSHDKARSCPSQLELKNNVEKGRLSLLVTHSISDLLFAMQGH